MFEFIQGADINFELISRLCRAQVQSPGNGIFSKQYALRATQDFYPLHVKKGCTYQLLAAIVNAIHILPNGLLKALVIAGADAAHIHLGADTGFCHAQIRDILGNIGNFIDVTGIQNIRTDDINGNRHIGKVLLTFLSGNDNFLQSDGLCCQWSTELYCCNSCNGCEKRCIAKVGVMHNAPLFIPRNSWLCLFCFS